MAEFGEPLADLRHRLREDPAARLKWDGIHRFCFEDRLATDDTLSRTRARDLSKRDAYEVVRRSDAFGNVVAAAFPTAIRLSIHPQPVGGAKLGIKLVRGGDRWSTPWHNAPVLDSAGGVTLMRRHQAEQLGAERRQWRGRWEYLAAPGADAASLDDRMPWGTP